MSSNNCELIFERWVAELKNKDRTLKAVPGNFDELFQDLKTADIDFNTAHEFLAKGIKAHLPAPGLVRNLYKSYKKVPGNDLSEKEYTEGWHKAIADAATESFYVFYPLPTSSGDEDSDEPKVYGNMSAREYTLQRRYAESFPILDTTELEKRLRSDVYNPGEDELLNVLGKDDGETN